MAKVYSFSYIPVFTVFTLQLDTLKFIWWN